MVVRMLWSFCKVDVVEPVMGSSDYLLELKSDLECAAVMLLLPEG